MTDPAVATAGPSRERVWHMFDRIAHRYDLLNRLLSGGTDVAWRKAMARHLPAGDNLQVLDLATGTADVLLFLEQQSSRLGTSVGSDMSAGMLHLGNEKLRKRGLDQRFRLVRSDATDLVFQDQTFDVVTISFGIRNVLSVEGALREMHRVLRPGGRAMVLEFSLPANRPFRALYLWYFRNILPLLGGLISGDRYAYRYLNQTVETFPYGEAFCQLMRDAGFENVRGLPFTFGIATLYLGDKP